MAALIIKTTNQVGKFFRKEVVLMKKLLSIALVAVMLLTVSAVALADDTTVFIPSKLSKLGVDMEAPEFISLSTSNDGSDIVLEFSETPDWGGVNWSEGWENMVFDGDSTYVTSRDGHDKQPGKWAWTSGDVTCDPLTGAMIFAKDVEDVWVDGVKQNFKKGDFVPKAVQGNYHGTGGEYAYMAGKGNVKAEYNLWGHVNYYVVTTDEDYFQTGMEGASTDITYTYYKIPGDSGYYVSSVVTTYPDTDETDIVKVQADWRNDENYSLASYRITYATSETEQYEIIYAPATSSVLQYKYHPNDWSLDTAYVTWFRTDEDADGTADHRYSVPKDAPEMKGIISGVVTPKGKVVVGSPFSVTHYTQDEVVGGFYRKGSLTLVSGSGKKLGNWYKFEGTEDKDGVKTNKTGKQYKNSKYGLKKCTAFPSPRVQ